jgi:hypothetical protein
MSNKSKDRRNLSNAFVLLEGLMTITLSVAGILTVLLLLATINRIKWDIGTRLDVISLCTNNIEFCKNEKAFALNQSDRFKFETVNPKVAASTTERLISFLGLQPNDDLREVKVVRLHANAVRNGREQVGETEVVASLF